MTRFAYEDLYSRQFEELVVLLCQELLGMAVQGFADGADGGRDARFHGTAMLIPSKAEPWVGRVVIQAKHTSGINRSFSETDFHSPGSKSSIVAEELPKIKALKDAGKLDHYMLFANRRLTAGAEDDIRETISATVNIPSESVLIYGIEQLEMWLKRFGGIVDLAALDPIDAPLIVSPDALAEIVSAFADQRELMLRVIDDAPVPRTSLREKDRINNMTDLYSKELRRILFVNEAVIRAFLSAPENADFLELYESTVEDFRMKIISKRKDYQSFDDVLEYLLEILYSRDPVLRQKEHKRLTRALLYYMYWNCDIGEVDDDAEAV